MTGTGPNTSLFHTLASAAGGTQLAFSDSDGGDPPPPQYEDLEEVRVAVKDDIVPQARMGAEEEWVAVCCCGGRL